MCGKSLTFCMLLLIASSLAFRSSSTNDDNKDNNLTVREFDKNTKRNYDKKAEVRKNNTNDNKDNCMMIIKFRRSQSLNHIVSHEMCDITYIRILCCPLNNCSIHKNCIAEENEYVFSNGCNYSNDSMQNENKKVDEFCPLIVQNPRKLYCSQKKYFSHSFFEFVEITKYYLTNVPDDQFNANICSKTVNEIYYKEMDKIIKGLYNKIYSSVLTILFYNSIVSMLCFLLIFLVYSILPELRNIYSFMLRRASSLQFIAKTIILIDYLFNTKDLPYSICVISVLVKYFCHLTSQFWLSVMSFDMWRTFRNHWSQTKERNVLSQRKERKQQERKKFIYSTIAWGGPFILIIIFIIMEFVLNVPENLMRPGFGTCWFYGNKAYLLYFFGPESIYVISNTCLSIYTALKIMRYKKDITRPLGYLERQSFNDKKQWLNLYLKLFIMLFIIIAIKWILLIIWVFWLIDDITKLYIYRIITLMTTIQDIGTFIIFVCKKTIMQSLLKHLCQNHGSISKSSRQNHCYELQQLRHQ